jgi:hypothetical protein
MKRTCGEATLGVFAQVIGDEWPSLPQQIADMHSYGATHAAAFIATGQATVERGPGWLARIVAAVIRFPEAGANISVQVQFKALEGAERWTRCFADKSFVSHMSVVHVGAEALLCERFGPLRFAQALVTDGDKLRLVLRKWSVCGLPLPLPLGPSVDAFESVRDGKFYFYVEIRHWAVGLIVRYQGWLVHDRDHSGSVL